MKKIACFIALISLLFSLSSLAQQTPAEGDRIIGIWESEVRDARMEVFKQQGKYFGRLLWGNRILEADGKTFKKDEKNPDPKLRSRSLQNVVNLKELVYQDGKWIDGQIYDPSSGKTYSCKVELKDNQLHMRGFLGVSLLGKTAVWHRMAAKASNPSE